MLSVKSIFFAIFLSGIAFSHTPDPSELNLPPDNTQYDIKIIEGNWDSPKISTTTTLKLKIRQSPTTTISEQPLVESPKDPSLTQAMTHYLVLGFEHILPKGTDHILFILGLFLFGSTLRSLLWQVSIFTLAHTMTLLLSSLHIASLPSSIVEPIIAASISFVAIENLFHTSMNKFRIVIIFIFGLLHGMGFAGALSEVGLPNQFFIPSLLSFNIGVEFGQLAVIGLAYAAVYLFRKKPWYRARITVPCSVIIALIGLYWTFQRI